MDPHWSSRQTYHLHHLHFSSILSSFFLIWVVLIFSDNFSDNVFHSLFLVRFERYLYDYLVKRNMHHTAEIFRNEAELPPDAAAASSCDAVDVPEGFLLEWWSLNSDFDFFKQMHDKQGLLGGKQGCNAFQEAGSSMNAEPMYQLPNNFTPVGALNRGSNLMPSHVPCGWPVFSSPSAHQKVSGELPQFLFPFSRQKPCGELQQLSSSHHEAVMTPVAKTTEVSNVNAPKAKSGFVEETDPLIDNLLKSFWMFEHGQPSLFDKPTVGESSRNAENLVECGDGNTGMNAIAGSAPALEEDDSISDTTDCSSSFQTDADASTDSQLESNGET
ncbi:hypothetical protein VNO80_30038 [Phaseolus coccineus]|uniref:LisH domain-containing protein n=1 Tax=Phaseolus coccineus TaxID=3886 RepID=A0AAN9QJ33_PHACN